MTPDLNDAELDRLEQLLAATPAPLEPLDLVMLDGYLCGVLVQPELIEPERWLPPVFDLRRRPLPEDADARWLDECRRLLQRRHAALNRALAEDGAFEPLLHVEPDAPAADTPALRDAWRELPPHSRLLMPWVAGFQHAALCFPALMALGDDEAGAALARLYRHLPAETADERALLAALEHEHPLPTLDDAIDDLVQNVAELWELTEARRYRVETVRRAGPKTGRNDPCPCGSGRKYKHCHMAR